MVDKPCECKEPCGHYAWLEDKDYLAEDLIEKDEKVDKIDLRKDSKDVGTIKHKIFMEGKCIRCKVKIKEIPEEVYHTVGLLEFPLHNFNACNGTLYHVECPKDVIRRAHPDRPEFAPSDSLVRKDLLLD